MDREAGGPERPEREGSEREPYGAVVGPGTVRIERLLPGPIERVWAYLTDGEKRAKWLAGGKSELRVGGTAEFRFHHPDISPEKEPPAKYREFGGETVFYGTVTRCEPPHVLSCTWGPGDDASEVTFELTPRGDDVLLVLTHRRLRSRGEMAEVAAGWHAHLGILIDRLEGREPRGFWTAHTRAEAEYAQRFVDAGAAAADA
ncbi:MAG TPA: SRPBCC family protein [Longimicrobiales bacterium]